MKEEDFFLSRYKYILTDPNPGFYAHVIRSFLVFLSYLYTCIIQGRFFLYKIRLLKSKKLPCKVISVGNITVGGTGKTPVVETLARMCVMAGKSPVILSRGYGRRQKGICLGHPQASYREIGDEPAMLARKLKGVPVVVGPNRFEAGRVALKNFNPAVVILDDGFQHLALKRDLDIVLIDATDPFGQGYLTPRGFLREPLRNLNRAHLFLITRSDEGGSLSEVQHTLRALNPRAPIWISHHRPSAIRTFQDLVERDPSSLVNKKILAFAGIGNGSSFLKTLEKMGLSPIRFLPFPDHHPYTLEELKEIEALACSLQVDGVITTEKDEVRMEGFRPQTLPFYVLVIQLEIFQFEEFQRFLINTIETRTR